MNLNYFFRYCTILLVLFTAYSIAENKDTFDIENLDSAIVHLSIDNSEVNDQPTDALPTASSLYQSNKYHPVRTLDKKITFVTTTRFVTNPRAPPIS
ncbi:hypothetical protein [Colwellia sp. 20A7]|uniref:hypothetical protein n=1 Tax=Colwellia sp. 20A7 TaxID=2689569 RepID=UPI0013591A16|nr:hypothetical protein [Colwellia sp. 20A7]